MTAANASRLYGDPNPVFTGTITGIKNADNITASYASAADPTTAVGTASIVPTLADPTLKLSNYTVTVNNGTLTINPAPLTVSGANASRLYGDPNPAFTGTITGLKNADNITATFASAATAASVRRRLSNCPNSGGSNQQARQLRCDFNQRHTDC